MSGKRRPPRPGGGLARLLEDERFIRGLGIGALIGAAIAGSTLWTRRREPNAANESASGSMTHEAPPATH